MKKVNFPILLFIGLFLYSNLSKASVKEWTILVYLGGDGHLEPNAIVDFNALEVGIDTTNYNVVVQLDRVPGYDGTNGDWTTCKRFLIKSDKLTDGVIRSTELADIGEVNMGDPQTLSDFIIWGMQNYQSKRYALVVWGSGTSRGICPDLTSSDDPLNTISGELTAALKESTEFIQKRMDLFVAWGCNYGTFEHDYIFKEYIDVIARSQLATWNAEGSATDILEWLNLYPSASAQEFAVAWVNAYTDYAILQGRCTGWAALDLNPKFVKLGTEIDIFARELIKAGGRSQPDIAAAIANSVYSYALEFDMCHFAKNISNTPSLPLVLRNAAQDLIDTYGYSAPYPGNPLLIFLFSEGYRAPGETWPTGDSTELRGSKIYKRNYSDFEGTPPPFGCDTAYAPFKMNNAWKWFLADSATLPNEVLLTYDSNSIGDSIISNGIPVLLNVTLRNSGGADASGISTMLLTSDSCVTITQPNSTYNNITSEGTGTNLVSFEINIDTSIAEGHRIWFRIDIIANGGAYTNTSTFCMETKKSTTAVPTLTTSAATLITDVAATLGGNITADGGQTITERGVVFSTTDNTPNINETGVTKDDNGTGMGSFSESIDSLTPGTTFYVQAYATNSVGTSYGGVQSFTTLQTQTITFNSLNAKIYGDVSFNLSASSSSGLTVSYISSNPSVATILGSAVTIVGIGSATITAGQSGDSIYVVAEDVQQILTVNPKTLTITGIFSVSNKVYDGTTTAVVVEDSLSLSGLITGDTVGFNYEVRFSQSDAGVNIPVNITSAELTGTDKDNYTLSLENLPATTAAIIATTNVDDIPISNMIVYPNPSFGVVNILLPVSGVQLKIFNAFGNVVFEKTLNSKSQTLNLNLPDGMYFYQLNDNKHFVSSGKLIVQ